MSRYLHRRRLRRRLPRFLIHNFKFLSAIRQYVYMKDKRRSEANMIVSTAQVDKKEDSKPCKAIAVLFQEHLFPPGRR